MIIGITGKAGSGKDTAANVLVDRFGFVKVSLADPLKRFCKEVFGFSDEQLWASSEKRSVPDKRYVRLLSREEKEKLVGEHVHCSHCGNKLGNETDRLIKFYEEKEVTVYLTPRYALQQLGTNWGRNCYSNIWVEYALRVVQTLLEKRVVVFGSDPTTNATEGHLDYDPRIGVGTILRPGAYTGAVIPDVRFKNEADAIRKVGGKIWRISQPNAGLEGVEGQHLSETEQDDIKADVTLVNQKCLNFLAKGVYAAYMESEGANTTKDGSQVSLNQPKCMDRLSMLLAERQKYVDAGRILSFDDLQKDEPPFKRKI